MDDIKVSVICLAYNHEKYIDTAINSLICQNTNFKYEIIIHDDASTDKTTEIIKKYKEDFPDLIKLIIEKENQYSKGKEVFIDRSIPYSNGKYIALCDGDDFWINEQKLQKQYDILEKYNQVDMCACSASVVSEDGSVEVWRIAPAKEDTILSCDKVILGGGRFVATSSLFFRKSIFESYMNFEKVLCFDYTHKIKGALRGGIAYLKDNMAAYRSDAKGSWSLRIEKNEVERDRHIEKEIEMLKVLDLETQGCFHDTIVSRLKSYTPFYEQLYENKDLLMQRITSVSDHGIFIWGMGMRGVAFMKFCKNEDIKVAGVCDIKNENIGNKNKFDIRIFSTEEVFEKANLIIATNRRICNYLKKNGFKGDLINLEEYAPLC